MTEPPDAVLARIEHAGKRIETPCGAGRMVWHAWGDGPALVLLHGGPDPGGTGCATSRP